jgi:formylglycine-generating enzyme required for sulfatase activity
MLEAMPSRSGRKSIEKRKEKAPPARVKGQELVRVHRARPGSYVETHAGLNLEMVWIAGGSFEMGSRLSPEQVAQKYGGRAEWFQDEHPRHPVDLDGFWLGKYEVTQRQYGALMGKNPSCFKGTDRPVECVTWDAAMEFCRKLSDATGKQYMLPTEAQWEFACRAGSEDEWACGNDPKDLGEFAWFRDNSEGYTHAMGGKRPNAWGLYDMHGNVWEWCIDSYDATFYQKCQNQGVVRNPINEEKSAARVVRGGYWFGNAGYCRSAFRYDYSPDRRAYSVGFRFVRTHGKP